jgi:hypothetical protein
MPKRLKPPPTPALSLSEIARNVAIIAAAVARTRAATYIKGRRNLEVDFPLATRRDPTGASQPTIKRLFALSGNLCAFPRCVEVLMQDSTVVGEICHIKAANPRGPRYDPQQTAGERHGYDNLVLLCGTHHKVIDDDVEAYTVERLLKMKADHESRAARVDDDFAERAARLLIINQSVMSLNQSGGITAHTIKADTINLHPPSVPATPRDTPATNETKQFEYADSAALTDEELEALEAMATRPFLAGRTVFPKDIAEILEILPERAKYIMEKLEAHGLLFAAHNYKRGTSWGVSSNGRAELVKRHLL